LPVWRADASTKRFFVKTQANGFVRNGGGGCFSLKKGKDFYFRRLTEIDRGGKKWGDVGQSGAKNHEKPFFP
jgi:hypothetical protein